MRVKFADLAAVHAPIRQDIDGAIARVLDSGWFIGGSEVEAFERDFASYCGAAHCVGVGNGLDALRLALQAMGIGPGDEVIVASNTFIASWLAVSMVGATPVPVEPDPATFNIDPDGLVAAITPRTKVIMPTHLFGQPADLDAIGTVARAHGLRILEDAAQAHGARYGGRRIGAHGDAVAWSFYPGKNLGAIGDAGAVTTNDPALAERVRLLGNYGSRQKYAHDIAGGNSRLDPIQAAVLGVKLRHLDRWNERRREVAATYAAGLVDTGVSMPHVPSWAEPVWHQYVVRSERRDALKKHLAERGIETMVHYPIPPHLQGAYADLGFTQGSLPVAEKLAQDMLSLPIGPHLDERSITAVVDAIRTFA